MSPFLWPFILSTAAPASSGFNFSCHWYFYDVLTFTMNTLHKGHEALLWPHLNYVSYLCIFGLQWKLLLMAWLIWIKGKMPHALGHFNMDTQRLGYWFLGEDNTNSMLRNEGQSFYFYININSLSLAIKNQSIIITLSQAHICCLDNCFYQQPCST